MHKLVANYLVEQQQKREKDARDTRNALLLKLGLYEKEYTDAPNPSSEYQEWDSTAQKYYRKVPVAVSDEEYAEILKYRKKEPAVSLSTGANTISVLFKAIGYFIFLIGFIVGIASSNVEVVTGTYYQHTTTEFSWALAFTYWGVAFISGMVFLGFSEIIQLLTDLKNK